VSRPLIKKHLPPRHQSSIPNSGFLLKKMGPILTVIGATGAQGSSVVAHALQTGIYKVRAITRSTSSAKAQALSAQGVEVIPADLNKFAVSHRSLRGKAFFFPSHF
jgi:nucleoside-diphosphate-sugar epimerase